MQDLDLFSLDIWPMIILKYKAIAFLSKRCMELWIRHILELNQFSLVFFHNNISNLNLKKVTNYFTILSPFYIRPCLFNLGRFSAFLCISILADCDDVNIWYML